MIRSLQAAPPESVVEAFFADIDATVRVLRARRTSFRRTLWPLLTILVRLTAERREYAAHLALASRHPRAYAENTAALLATAHTLAETCSSDGTVVLAVDWLASASKRILLYDLGEKEEDGEAVAPGTPCEPKGGN